MTVRHIDDVDVPTIRMVTDKSRPKWSGVRWGTVGVFAVATLLFALDVVSQPHHGVDDLPQLSIDVFRANWVLCIAAVVLACVYDRVAPKLFMRLSALRDGVRALHYEQAQFVKVARRHERELGELKYAFAQREGQLAEQIGQLMEKVERIADQAADRELEAYSRGFNSALDRGKIHITAPEFDDGKVVQIPLARRRDV